MSTEAIENQNVAETAHEGHKPPRYDDVDVPFIVLLGVFSAVITFVTIVFVQGLYYHWQAAQIDEKEYGKPVFAAEEIERQKKSLTGYLESKDDKQSIPIERAMELVLAESSQKASHGDHDGHATDDHAKEDSKGNSDTKDDDAKVNEDLKDKDQRKPTEETDKPEEKSDSDAKDSDEDTSDSAKKETTDSDEAKSN